MATTTSRDTWTIDDHDFPYGGNPQCRYRFLIRYAVLAPSGHNTQPWLFEPTHDALLLFADPTRALPVVDPDNRELIISCGCALEYLCIAACHFGYKPIVSHRETKDDPDLLARFAFGERIEPGELDTAMFNAIPDRHTNRNKFDDHPVPTEIIKQLRMLAGSDCVTIQFLHEESEHQTIARLVSEGDRIQADDPRFRRELASWVHSNRSHSRDGMPGFAFGIGDVASVFGPLVLRTFDWGKGQAAKDEQLVMGSPLLAVLKTQSDTQLDWLNTGRALAQVLLYLTDQNLSASFLNQPIEVADLRVALKHELGDDGDPQILLRIGRGPKIAPTPRRSAADVTKAAIPE